MAVYTEVSDEDLGAFLEGYDLGTVLSFKGIAEGVENSNYLLRTARDSYILTLYEKRVAPVDLPFFLGLMELLEGLWPKRILPKHCRALGEAMARMHLAGADFGMTRANDLSVQGWRPLLEACAERAHEVEPGLAEDLAGELDHLEAQWPRDLPAGVIHADLFPDNVFFLQGRLSGIIDFYFACNDAFAYDLAVCLNAWCFERDNAFNVTKARALLQAYRKVRPFSAAELEALPLLARGSALRFLLTRLYDFLNVPEGALVAPKDPLEYRNKLRFHREVRGPGAYGLD